MINKTNYFLFLCISVSLLLFSGCSKSNVSQTESQTSDDVYKIAVAAPQFGPYEALGLSIVHGAELAVEMKNESGGIDGKKIELVKVDDGGLSGEGTWKARDLVNQMVLGVIGHLNSDISIPASEIYSKAKIPQITPGSTSPFFTERDAVRGYVFRTVGRDDKQGEISAHFALDKGFKKIAVLYNDRGYGLSLSSEFVKKINTSAKDANVVFYEKYKVGTKDFSKEINSLKNTPSDLVFFAGEYADAGRFLKQLRKAGINSAFLGGEAVFDPEFISSASGAAEGAFILSLPEISDKSFSENYKKRFKRDVGAYSSNSFDAANILISAIEKVKAKDPNQIAEEVRKTKDFPGLSGKISFDSKGDLTDQRFSVYEVKNGMFVGIN